MSCSLHEDWFISDSVTLVQPRSIRANPDFPLATRPPQDGLAVVSLPLPAFVPHSRDYGGGASSS